MISALVEGIKAAVAVYGPLGAFAAGFVEEIIVPIPAALIPLLAGFFLLPAGLPLSILIWQSLLIVGLPVAAGAALGSLFLYYLFFFGGKAVIDRFGRWLGLRWSDIGRAEARLTRGHGDEVALFLLRAIPIVPNSAVSGFCGLIRYPVGKFLLLTFAGGSLRASFLGLFGSQVGEAYVVYEATLSRLENFIFLFLVLAAALWLLSWYFKRRRLRSKNIP